MVHLALLGELGEMMTPRGKKLAAEDNLEYEVLGVFIGSDGVERFVRDRPELYTSFGRVRRPHARRLDVEHGGRLHNRRLFA